MNVAPHDTQVVATGINAHMFYNTTIFVAPDTTVVHKSTSLLTTDANVALESAVAPPLVVALVKDIVDLLKNNFLKECDIVDKYGKGKVDMKYFI